jgi:hypothetical protein
MHVYNYHKHRLKVEPPGSDLQGQIFYSVRNTISPILRA